MKHSQSVNLSLLFMFFILSLTTLSGCSGPDQVDIITDSAVGHDARALLNKYGLKINLPPSWDGYTVSVIEPGSESPNSEQFKAIDKKYIRVQISPPHGSDISQDLYLVGFRVGDWNDYDTFEHLPQIVTFSEKYVYSIDPYYYESAKEGYGDIIDILMGLTYVEYDEGPYKTLDVVTIETDQIIYSDTSDVLRIKWRNILKDELFTNGHYTIEQYVNQSWHVVETFDSDELAYAIKREETWINYPITPLEIGMYRIGTEFKRFTLYGLELTSPLYKTYDDFKVGHQDTLRTSDDSLEGVGLETEYEIYPESVTEIHAKWYNTLDDEMMYGNSFTLEQLTDQGWSPIKSPHSDIAFNSLGYTLEAYKEKWQHFDLSIYTDKLDKGQYRISTSLHRMTLDGIDFGPGNYPTYQFYSEFEVGDTQQERDMMNLHPEFYVYKNKSYNLVMYLPKDWAGVTLVEEEQAIDSPIHDLLYALDSNYCIIRFQHPNPTLNQDIVFTLIAREQWNNNAHAATNNNLDLLPDNVFSNGRFLFIRDPYHYDKSLNKYDEVNLIINDYLEQY